MRKTSRQKPYYLKRRQLTIKKTKERPMMFLPGSIIVDLERPYTPNIHNEQNYWINKAEVITILLVCAILIAITIVVLLML